MDHTREILTFQLGTYANYVGAHFWNQQEANFVYDQENGGNVAEEQLPHNDILYREGRNDQKQTTYTPRMLSVDLVGTLGHLPVVGELYGNFLQLADEQNADQIQKVKELAEQNKLSTHGELDVRKQPAATLSEYQQDLLKGVVNTQDKDYNLAGTCNSWADYLYARYHPRSFNLLHGLVRQPDVQVLGTHAAGVELWQSVSFNEDFCDRIRMYAEECDGLQGFQLLFDIDDGFSGLASKCLEHLNDEYSRASFVLPLHYPRNIAYAQADPRTAHSIRVANNVLSYYHLSEQANMFTPLSTLETIWRNNTLQSRRLPGLHWQPDNLYQSSAVLAAYLDTVTLGYRLRQTPETLLRFCDRVCPSGRKMTAAALALPLGMQQEQDLIDYLDQGASGPLFTQLTPGCEPGNSHIVQSVVARGIPQARLKRPLELAGPQLRMSAYKCDSVSQMLQLYYQCAYHGSLTHAAATPLPLKTQLPFPYEIFETRVAPDGFMLPGEAQREPKSRVASAPALAAIQNSSKLGEHLDALHGQTHRVQVAKLRGYSQSGFERDEYEMALDKLLEFRDNYQDSQYL
ncbi:protein misato [Drosophila novamexicana]|uniref:protein misato n=1 Tax=Drosophila novamexicana TaxID=47314 RepID=UPI0011E60713|nr:protein misato [Drosophila novamexicana]